MDLNPIKLRHELVAAKNAVVERFLSDDPEQQIDVTEMMAQISELVDEATDTIAEAYLENFKDKVCVIYTGGNGREEAMRHSDVDTFLLVDDSLFDGVHVPEGQEEFEEAFQSYVMAMADAGLSVGLAIRTTDLCVIDSINEITRDGRTETWTQQLDRREGWGSSKLYAQMDNKLKSVKPEDRLAFITSTFERYDKSLQERDQQDSSTAKKGFDGSRYTVIEPDVKHGYGSLRGYQTAKWILKESRDHNLTQCKIIKKTDEMRAGRAYKFLQKVRAHLHYVSGNKTDKLYSHYQPDLAESMGYLDEKSDPDITALMKDYFAATRTVSNYTRIVCSDVAEQLGIKPPGASSEKTISFENGKINEPMDIMRLFLDSANPEHTLHYSAMYAIEKNVHMITDEFVQDPKADRIMMEILSHDHAEETLMYMNKLGVLTKFIPELESARELMEFDPHHAYTVDDHSIIAIGNVADLINQKYVDRSSVASSIAKTLTSEDRRALSAVLLLHGVYKAEKSKAEKNFDIKAYNQELLKKVGGRLGLDDDEMEMASWLMENRLLLKHTARHMDIEELEDITNFAERIPSPKHLDLLRVITFADSKALGPGRPSAHSSLRADNIFSGTCKVLSGLKPKFNHSAFQLPEGFVDNGKPYISIADNEAINADTVTVITPDKPFLIENMAASIIKSGCKILNARITTVKSESVRAVNTFVVQNHAGEMLEDWQVEKLEKNLSECIENDGRVEVSPPSLNEKYDVFKDDIEVEFSNEISNEKTIVRVAAPNRPGLFHTLTVAFNDMDLNLTHANITTQGHLTTIASQVHQREGGQVTPEDQDKLERIIKIAMGDKDAANENELGVA